MNTEFEVRPVDAARDAELLHGWLTDPKSYYWLMTDYSLADVEREFTEVAASPHYEAFIGSHEGVSSFLFMTYDPAHVELVGLYEHLPGDVGMHFLCAPTDRPIHGFTLAVIQKVMEHCFADPAVERVVVEPDVNNEAVHALNLAVGFEVVGKVAKPEKEALLSICTRKAFLAVRGERA